MKCGSGRAVNLEITEGGSRLVRITGNGTSVKKCGSRRDTTYQE